MNDNLHNKTVLVCPLNWGLGHATRCVPVIREFVAKGAKVVVAADDAPLAFLKKELENEDIRFTVFPWRAVEYQKRGSFFFKLFLQSPNILYSIWKEHKYLKKVIADTAAEIVISDNRFGLWSKKITSVFITHQVFIKAPRYFKWTEPILYFLNRLFLSKYNQCWVPDLEGEPNLSGALSHKKPKEYLTYVGLLSRFSGMEKLEGDNPLPKNFPKDFILVMLSGPEPQRGILEAKLSEEFENIKDAVVFLRGKANSNTENHKENHIWFDHLPTSKMLYLIKNSRIIVCRSGYSTLMDLSFFNKKALLIPTPGQTEQEYLAKLYQQNNWNISVSYNNIDLKTQLELAEKTSGIPNLKPKENFLEKAIQSLLNH
jgi:UDP:flavonoid glycosyltransferase YjiC (YdhE family)